MTITLSKVKDSIKSFTFSSPINRDAKKQNVCGGKERVYRFSTNANGF